MRFQLVVWLLAIYACSSQSEPVSSRKEQARVNDASQEAVLTSSPPLTEGSRATETKQAADADDVTTPIVAFAPLGTQQFKLLSQQILEVEITAAPHFSGDVNLELAYDELQEIDPEGKIKFSLMQQSLSLQAGQSQTIKIDVQLASDAPPLTGSHHHFHIIAVGVSPAQAQLVKTDIAFEVLPEADIFLYGGVVTETQGEKWSIDAKPIKFQQSVKVNFISSGGVDHFIHGSGMISHQETSGATQDGLIYSVQLTQTASLQQALVWCHNHETIAHKHELELLPFANSAR